MIQYYHENEEKAVELKRKNPKLGQDKIRYILSQQYSIEISSSTINRILNEKRLIKKRKKKWQKKRDLTLSFVCLAEEKSLINSVRNEL